MKKLLLNFIKTHEQKSKLDLISELLISGSVSENIELFNKIKSNFHHKMDLYKQKKETEINLINRIRPIKEYNTDFDKSYETVVKDYEIVKTN